jgi:solute carrier family 25 S-adenosylmethionine transporter 26
VRVPFETIKQRMQVGMHAASGFAGIASRQGIAMLYRGLPVTLQREIPFAMLQFPLYEAFKQRSHAKASGLEAAVCGSLAGGITAALTTPLDVLKTRTMLAQRHVPSANTFKALVHIAAAEGPGTLFAGAIPRVLWISLGGFVFFGVYEKAKGLLSPPQTDHRL